MTDNERAKAKERANMVLGIVALAGFTLLLLAQAGCVVWIWRHALGR